jgi:UDP:flavonoid glycosyltransferase YjiC (YdhE family)
MATILAYTSPALGHLYPIIAVTRELQARGHHIVIKTLADGLDTARHLGFAAIAIDPRIENVAMHDWRAPNARAALDATMAVFGERALLEVDDARRAVTDYHRRRELLGSRLRRRRGWPELGDAVALHAVPPVPRCATLRSGTLAMDRAGRAPSRRAVAPPRHRSPGAGDDVVPQRRSHRSTGVPSKQCRRIRLPRTPRVGSHC